MIKALHYYSSISQNIFNKLRSIPIKINWSNPGFHFLNTLQLLAPPVPKVKEHGANGFEQYN